MAETVEFIAEHAWTQWVVALSDRQLAVLFFALVIVGAMTRAVGLFLWRGSRRKQLTGQDDAYAIAYAAGGMDRAVTVALMSLSSYGLVQPSAVKGRFMAVPGAASPKELTDLESMTLLVCQEDGEQTIPSIARNQKAAWVGNVLEQHAIKTGLLRPVPNLMWRVLWAAPIFAAATLGGLRVVTGLHRGQEFLIVAIGAAAAFLVALMAVSTAGEPAGRRLFSMKVTKHPALAGAMPISGAPSAETYRAMRQSGVPALAGLGGVAAVSGLLLFWSAANTDMLVAAERALMSTSSGGDSAGADSDSGGGDSSCGGGCGGCG